MSSSSPGVTWQEASFFCIPGARTYNKMSSNQLTSEVVGVGRATVVCSLRVRGQVASLDDNSLTCWLSAFVPVVFFPLAVFPLDHMSDRIDLVPLI